MADTARVLIVDDSRIFRAVIEEALAGQEGITVSGSVFSGEKALEFIKATPPDVVTLDVQMPQMDGLQLLAKVKEMEHMKNVPVIMITTEGGQGKVMEAVQLGATGYVRKPFTADQIKEKLVGILT